MARMLAWSFFGNAVVALLLSTIVGCGDEQSSNGASGEPDKSENQTEVSTTNTNEEKKNEKDKEPEERTTLAGNWLLVVCEQDTRKPIGILEFKKNEKQEKSEEESSEFDVKLLDVWEGVGNQVLVSSKMNGKKAEIILQSANGPMSYQGVLEKGLIRGSMMHTDLEGFSLPMMLHPYPGNKLPPKVEPIPYPLEKELFTLLEKTEEDTKLKLELCRKFSAEHPRSPLCMFLYVYMFGMARHNESSAEEIDEIANDYVATAANWGPRYQEYARIQIGKALLQNNYLPKTAKEYLKKAEENFSEKNKTSLLPLVSRLNKVADTFILLKEIKSKDAPIHKKAAEGLAELLKKRPFNLSILIELADYYKKEKQTDQAIQRYAELAVIPLFESSIQRHWEEQQLVDKVLPSETVAILWKEKHGSTEKLDDYLDGVYQKLLSSIPDEKVPPRGVVQGKHIVLGELFTGAMCPACASVDMATHALESTFEQSEFIMLRYHIPVNGPDQMANQDTLNRQMYYRQSGAPIMYIDGQLAIRGGGRPEQSQQFYEQFKQIIKQRLNETSHLGIDLSAEAKAGMLNLKVNVKGVKPTDSSLRLRLVLVEDSISLVSDNGIRHHEMVVRSMPGGYEGIDMKDGKLSFESSISLADFKQDLVEFIEAVEEETEQLFAVKPLALDKLHLVAIVQDDQSSTVIQSAIIPVTGKLEYPKPPVAPKEAPKPTKPELKKPEDKPKSKSPKPAETKKSAPTTEKKPTEKSPAAKPESTGKSEKKDTPKK